MALPDRVIAVAKLELGYLEKKTNSQLDDKTANAGFNNYTKYARDLAAWGVYNASKQGFAWCDMFVDWSLITAYGLDTALKMTGQPKGGYGAGCTESANYYKAIGAFYTKPQVGDQIFFTSDNGKTMYHTGLVWKVTDTMVYTIEGNTSSTLGVVDNGGGVFEKYYQISSSKIGGYGRPNYSLVPADINYNSYNSNYNTSDINYNNETEEEELTQEQFNTFMNNYLAQNTGAACSSWAQEACDKAIENGVVLGDGSGNYKWPLPLTREAFVVMANRMGLIG